MARYDPFAMPMPLGDAVTDVQRIHPCAPEQLEFTGDKGPAQKNQSQKDVSVHDIVSTSVTLQPVDGFRLQGKPHPSWVGVTLGDSVKGYRVFSTPVHWFVPAQLPDTPDLWRQRFSEFRDAYSLEADKEMVMMFFFNVMQLWLQLHRRILEQDPECARSDYPPFLFLVVPAFDHRQETLRPPRGTVENVALSLSLLSFMLRVHNHLNGTTGMPSRFDKDLHQYFGQNLSATFISRGFHPQDAEPIWRALGVRQEQIQFTKWRSQVSIVHKCQTNRVPGHKRVVFWSHLAFNPLFPMIWLGRLETPVMAASRYTRPLHVWYLSAWFMSAVTRLATLTKLRAQLQNTGNLCESDNLRELEQLGWFPMLRFYADVLPTHEISRGMFMRGKSMLFRMPPLDVLFLVRASHFEDGVPTFRTHNRYALTWPLALRAIYEAPADPDPEWLCDGLSMKTFMKLHDRRVHPRDMFAVLYRLVRQKSPRAGAHVCVWMTQLLICQWNDRLADYLHRKTQRMCFYCSRDSVDAVFSMLRESVERLCGGAPLDTEGHAIAQITAGLRCKPDALLKTMVFVRGSKTLRGRRKACTRQRESRLRVTPLSIDASTRIEPVCTVPAVIPPPSESHYEIVKSVRHMHAGMVRVFDSGSTRNGCPPAVSRHLDLKNEYLSLRVSLETGELIHPPVYYLSSQADEVALAFARACRQWIGKYTSLALASLFDTGILYCPEASGEALCWRAFHMKAYPFVLKDALRHISQALTTAVADTLVYPKLGRFNGDLLSEEDREALCSTVSIMGGADGDNPVVPMLFDKIRGLNNFSLCIL